MCWAWKAYACTFFRYGGLSDLLGSGGSTGSENIPNYEDICNFGLFKRSSAKALCHGLGCNALPLVNAPLGWIMGGRAQAGVEVVSSVSFVLLAFHPRLHHCSASIRKEQSQLRRVLGEYFDGLWGIASGSSPAKCWTPPAAAHSP